MVLAGAGKAFCAGHDLKEMGATCATSGARPVRALPQVMLRLARMPQPVIAQVHGIATAAGCQLVAACDLAVCGADARFATSGVKSACSARRRWWRCPQPGAQAGHGDAADRRPRRCAEALRTGLVNQVVAPDELDGAVQALARLLDKPPAVLAMGKRAFYQQLELGLEEAYRLTTEVIVGNALSQDFALGLEAFVAKCKPEWPQA